MKCKSRKFKIKYRSSIQAGNGNEVRIWLAQPVDSLYQKINSFNVNKKPGKAYRDDRGNKILYFQFKDEQDIKLEFDMEAVLWQYRIKNNETKAKPSSAPSLVDKYTASEKFLEQTAAVKKLAAQFDYNKENAAETLKMIFRYVIENFSYCYPVKYRGVKNLDLNILKGDCAEYSSLFVALARSLKIPASNFTGFVIYPDKKSIVEHGWAGVYFKNYGWLDMDTQYASLEKNINKGIKAYFLNRYDYRLTFTSGFNIPLRPRLNANMNLDYWNKLGLPLNRFSVQTLQPLVFASRRELKFKDSIQLI